ncbi:LOW QUALITY PROTEIN: 3-oxo-5-alpha-steroid 4-dehydrogenase 2-like [Aulostomus maculatus]
MHCHSNSISFLSFGMILTGLGHLLHHRKTQTSYGFHREPFPPTRMVPAKLAWVLQEIPAVLIPLLLMLTHEPSGMGKKILLGTFVVRYFQRTFVYSLLTRGTPLPLGVMVAAGSFCSVNGFLQGHYLLHCAQLEDQWSADYCCKAGLLLFYPGMAINIRDYIVRNLRKPGEFIFKIPSGGLFEYESGTNYFGEMVEWFYLREFKEYPRLRKALMPFIF